MSCHDKQLLLIQCSHSKQDICLLDPTFFEDDLYIDIYTGLNQESFFVFVTTGLSVRVIDFFFLRITVVVDIGNDLLFI